MSVLNKRERKHFTCTDIGCAAENDFFSHLGWNVSGFCKGSYKKTVPEWRGKYFVSTTVPVPVPP